MEVINIATQQHRMASLRTAPRRATQSSTPVPVPSATTATTASSTALPRPDRGYCSN
jgi:hypothetical protein